MDPIADQIINGQLFRHVGRLHEWEKNKQARFITEKNFDKLKDDIYLNGVLDEFKILEDGTVLDGNNRYRAIKALIDEGITKSRNEVNLLWVPIKVEVAETEADKWKIALRRNGHYASWSPEGLNNFLPEFEDVIDLNVYNISFAEPRSIQDTLEMMENEYKKTEAEQEAAKAAAEVNPNVKDNRVATCPACGHEFEA